MLPGTLLVAPLATPTFKLMLPTVALPVVVDLALPVRISIVPLTLLFAFEFAKPLTMVIAPLFAVPLVVLVAVPPVICTAPPKLLQFAAVAAPPLNIPIPPRAIQTLPLSALIAIPPLIRPIPAAVLLAVTLLIFAPFTNKFLRCKLFASSCVVISYSTSPVIVRVLLIVTLPNTLTVLVVLSNINALLPAATPLSL